MKILAWSQNRRATSLDSLHWRSMPLSVSFQVCVMKRNQFDELKRAHLYMSRYIENTTRATSCSVCVDTASFTR